jgi:hypothetical protein
MPIPIILALAAAGALAGGGIGTAVGGVMWFRKTGHEAARDEAVADSKNITDVLRQRMTEQQVRDEAKAAGVDVDAAVNGYKAAKDGVVRLADVAVRVALGDTGVPISKQSLSKEVLEEARATITADGVASNSDIRMWGRANGYVVKDRGPLPKALLEAFRAAQR